MIVPKIDIIQKFKETHGAMSVVEGLALFNIAFDAPEGMYLELGTHRGKSSLMIAAAMQKDGESKERRKKMIVAITRRKMKK